MNQDDVEAAFAKAFNERPKQWSDFFIDYYTTQGYGKSLGLEGFSGTIEVLKARKEFEEKIIERLDITKVILNNSKYDLNEAVSILTAILKDV